MIYRVLADGVFLVHVAFIVFVVLGGFVVLRWPRVALVHLPVAAWGALIEFGGWVCPLTPLENHFRILGGQQPYTGGFIAHYLGPIVYPEGLTRGVQVGIGAGVLVLNGALYLLVLLRWRRARRVTR